MANEFIRDTAKALVYVSGLQFDSFAFDDSEDITEDEKLQIQKEIEKFCDAGLKRLELKYKCSISRESTEKIINNIMFE